MRDITLGETFYHFFTTRAFATGVPTSLLGTPVLSVLEENNITPITAGVSVAVDRASVTGLNQATIVATSGNGFEAGKSYAIYISTGTVGGTSVIGEVVGEFTIQASAAFTRLGAPAGASTAADIAAVKVDTAAILVDTGTTLQGEVDGIQADTEDIQARLPAALTVNGNMKSSLMEILATALTETAGLLAGGFKKFFNVATPTGTVNSLADAVPGAAGGGFIAGTNAATSVTTALTANITGNLSGSVGSLGATAKTDVNAEVVDALATDTYAEPGQEAPAATLSIAKKIGYLFKAWRNKSTQDATTYKLYADDAATVDQKATTSDDATTFTKGEVGTGP